MDKAPKKPKAAKGASNTPPKTKAPASPKAGEPSAAKASPKSLGKSRAAEAEGKPKLGDEARVMAATVESPPVAVPESPSEGGAPKEKTAETEATSSGTQSLRSVARKLADRGAAAVGSLSKAAGVVASVAEAAASGLSEGLHRAPEPSSGASRPPSPREASPAPPQQPAPAVTQTGTLLTREGGWRDNVQPPPTQGPVLWVASEAVPLASTGGLGDVVGALPAVLRTLGWDVRVCLPYYRRQIKQAVSGPLLQFDLDLAEPLRFIVRTLVDPPDGVPVYLFDCPPLFDRGGLYVDASGAFVDNPYRFGAFQLAVQELAAQLDPLPSIIHSHDWHASLLPALVRLPGESAEKLHHVRTIFTIHNLQYQGDTERGIIDVLQLPPQSWHLDWAEHYGRFIPMKAAIMTADRVTTVSPTYAQELRGPVRGQGLDAMIRSRGSDMRGLINGIDDGAWNPATDKHLKANFSVSEPQARLECTRALRAEVGLPDRPERPLIGFIGRLVEDKGVDLIMDALPQILALDVQVVILGSGEKELETRLRALEETHSEQGFRALIKFDLALSRRLYSSFDILLVPSRLEPCGLVQLYALRYGAVPIVHGVGGLKDTVQEGINGFLFHEPSAQALTDAVMRAVSAWDDQPAWKALQKRGMSQDWSWKSAALPYDALYRDVLSTPVRRQPITTPPPAPLPQPAPAPVKVVTASFRLMVQGPRALYAYWDLPGKGPFELVVEERPSGVIFTVAAELPSKAERWMGALPDQAYRAFLRSSDGGVCALSNAVVTPLEAPPPPQTPQPQWLEAAVEVGVFETDQEGRRWAAVFPDAASFTATPEGHLEPQWAEQRAEQEHHEGAVHLSQGSAAEFGAGEASSHSRGSGVRLSPDLAAGTNTPPAVQTNPQPSRGRDAGAHAPPQPAGLRTGSPGWPLRIEPRSLPPVQFALEGANSAALVRPRVLEETTPPGPPIQPGPRALDMRDVHFNPADATTSAEAAAPTSAAFASLGRQRK